MTHRSDVSQGIDVVSLWRREIEGAETSFGVFRLLRRIADSFGFAGFLVMRALEAGATTIAPSIMLNSLNPDFVRAFDELQLLTADHGFMRVASALEPLASFGSDPCAFRGNDNGAQDLLAEFGIGPGVLVPVHSRNGRKGVVAFVGRDGSVPSTNLVELQHLAMLAHDRLVELTGHGRREPEVLTDRERQCLTWTSAGKTSHEISTILGISAHTVDHYLATAGQKLDTVNRAHTVATALRRGLIV